MSPRAAWRLESLGFQHVIDFVPGKQAWYDENNPREGKAADDIWIGDVAADGVPTCGLRDRIGAIRDRVRAAGWEACPVINDQGILLGLVRRKALDADPNATAESVMDSGPKTHRPSVTLETLLAYMREHDIKGFSLVTTSEGRLIGAISRNDAEATFSHKDHADHEDHVHA
jgi:CBS domain-containing protein